MSKLRATQYLNDIRANGMNVDAGIPIVISKDNPSWMRVETLAYLITQANSDFEVGSVTTRCTNSIYELRDELVYSRQARKADAPPRLDVWMLSSNLKYSSTIDFLLDTSRLSDFKQNLHDSGYNPLSKRCEFNDQQGVAFLLDNQVYRNIEDVQKAYIEFVAAICSEQELDSNIEIFDKFLIAYPDVSSIKIYGKTALDLFNQAGHERTASVIFSRMVDAATESISNEFKNESIPEFAETLNNSL
ncbi:hypothetical protein GCM10011607_28370 [Shewanella inventionis]|uniref:Uncharacterized protein n=1 Tax=Shewanella inventionis TaxID=1738770 RepID=A0ABQ1JD97_9GAMM|nr:hypothetical protein [Shewanella inventionis]GGB65996.1 hypothetical protein GCM10011607_28370 [Shewanella inventionis]